MPARQITAAPHGQMLTNAGIWSPDSAWILFDTRSGPDGSSFDGRRIGRVELATGRSEMLYESRHGACCGVVTASPLDDRVMFILGPERPTADWSYGPARRQGVVLRTDRPGMIEPLDARDLLSPFTPGALRGGSHVHMFSPDGLLVSFTYEDAVLEAAADDRSCERNLRGLAVTICGRPVVVPKTHPRNQDGSGFTVLVTRLHDRPEPGSDQISKAFEEAWIGSSGYLGPNGSRRRYGLAFQGHVVTAAGRTISEVYVVDLPDDPAGLAIPGDGPLEGTPLQRPRPPAGVLQRRLTFTADRPHPGIQGPRHWLRSSPDGRRIGCLMRDDRGVVQLCTVSPAGGGPVQLTSDPWDVASSFTWSPDGERIAYVGDGSIMTVDVRTAASRRLTGPDRGESGPRPEAVVFSPDGLRIAFMAGVPLPGTQTKTNQIFVVDA